MIRSKTHTNSIPCPAVTESELTEQRSMIVSGSNETLKSVWTWTSLYNVWFYIYDYIYDFQQST